MKTPFLTIFTPAYNRAHLLPRLYESLCRQSNQNFIWLVVDDGSTDDTQLLVQTWIDEGKLSIRYAYKENGGMHTAHNLAYELIDTELNTCIDSDDYMPDNAVELILETWEKRSNEHVAGIVGLDVTDSGNLIGTRFCTKYTTMMNFYDQGGKGDKKLVYRTSVIKSVPPYPEFVGEKLVPLSYKYMLIDKNYHLMCLDQPLCIVEYQLDGSSNNIYKQYLVNPRGFAFFKNQQAMCQIKLSNKIKNTIQFGAFSLLLNDYIFYLKSWNKYLSILFYPFSIILALYMLFRGRRNV